MKPLHAAILLCFFSLYAVAQEIPLRYYDIQAPVHKKKQPAYNKISNSLYKNIYFLDCRVDSNYIGSVSVGLLNHEGRLKLRTPFQPQLQSLLDSLTDGSAANGELLFQLRKFRFVEEWATRYCYLQAGLYVKTENQYQRLSILDTVMVVTSRDVTGTIEYLGSKIMTDFLSSQLLQRPSDTTSFPVQEVLRYDSIEKNQLPLFTATAYTDGIYNSYHSFSLQQPDRPGQIKINKHGDVTSVSAKDSTGKMVKLKYKDLYAFVYEGKPYIATEYDYYPVEKMSNNFYFTGKVKVAASESDKGNAQFTFGLIGRALASGGYEATYGMFIDYISGVFIHLRKIPVPDPIF